MKIWFGDLIISQFIWDYGINIEYCEFWSKFNYMSTNEIIIFFFLYFFLDFSWLFLFPFPFCSFIFFFKKSVKNLKRKKIGLWRSRIETNAFELSCWRTLLRIPWIAKETNQNKQTKDPASKSARCSNLTHNTRFKLPYFEHIVQRPFRRSL